MEALHLAGIGTPLSRQNKRQPHFRISPSRRVGTEAAFAGCPGGAERKTPC
jgi:hypothetical protein